jgi:glycosyltransferase involved in cell wall biosynthesis/FMN phosphatase YigB (HAD superfamily)
VKKIAIITRTKNRPILLQRSIESVLGQSYQDWLHVIVNDGGDSLGLEALLSVYRDRYGDRLLVLHHDASWGMQEASNHGIRESQSTYLVIHDDDDSWTPDFLRQCVHHLETLGPDSVVQGVATQSIQIHEEIDANGQPCELSRNDFCPFEIVSLFQIAGGNMFPPIAFLYRRAMHDRIGYFRQQFDALGDWDYNMRFLAHAEIDVLRQRLAYYHWRHQNLGSTYGNTVTDGLTEHHVKMTVRLRNAYLREDLQQGRMGLGYLMNVSASSLNQVQRQVATAQAGINEIDHKLCHLLQTTSDLTRIWHAKKWVAGKVADLRAQRARKTQNFSEDVRIETHDGKIMARLDRAVQGAPVVSLDVFDTLLMRRVRKPTDVFLFIQPWVRELLTLPNLDYPTVRVNAERLARATAQAAGGSTEIVLSDIYRSVQAITGCSDAIRDALMQRELEAEERLLYACPGLPEWVAGLASKNTRVLYVSDMYLEKAQIAGLLERRGFAAPDVEVSSERRCTKYEGGLFDVVLNDRKLDPSSVVHVGDHPVSDGEQPRQRGMKTVAWKLEGSARPLVDQIQSFSGGWHHDIFSSVFTGQVRGQRWSALQVPVSEPETVWERVGYEVAGPLYLAYVKWVVNKALEQKVKRLYFLARDGHPLIAVARRLIEKAGLDLTCEYVYASRRLLNFPIIRKIDDAALAFLLQANPGMTVRNFFDRIDVPLPGADVLRKHGFSDPDAVIVNKDWCFLTPSMHQGMMNLMREHERVIVERAGDERRRVLDYLREIGLGDASTAVVDLGWQASSVQSLTELLGQAGMPNRFQSYYFATWQSAQPAIEKGCRLQSFYVHLHKPAWRAAVVAESVELIESFFAATHPTINQVRREASGWRPVYGQLDVSDGHRQDLERLQAAGLRFVEELLAWMPDWNEQPTSFGLGYIDTVLDRLLRHPTDEEARTLGALSLRSSFGGHGPLRYIAKVDRASYSAIEPSSLQRDYDHSYWKMGFKTQLPVGLRERLVG